MAMAIALATYLLDKGTYKVRGIQHPDLHFTFPTIKLKKWNSEYKPVSEDFIQQWEEMLQNGPYFTLAEWMEDRMIPANVRTKYVDDDRIKADTWYRLIDGKFCVVEQ